MTTNETDHISLDHPLARAVQEVLIWRKEVGGLTEYDAPCFLRLREAFDAHTPRPTFGERVLAHLPEGWEVDENDEWPFDDEGNRPEYRWAFKPPSRKDWYNSFPLMESSDPQAVAAALLLLSGERSEP